MLAQYSEKDAIEIAKKLLCLGQTVIEKVQETDIEYDPRDEDSLFKEGGALVFIAKVFLYTATDDFKATIILIENRLFNAAYMTIRRLFELAVDLRFIIRKPEERTKQFLMFEFIQREIFQRFFEEYWPNLVSIKISKELRDLMSKDCEEAINWMKSLGYKGCKMEKLPNQWSPHSTRFKCEEIGQEKEYGRIYKYCCMFAHPSPRGLRSFMRELPGGGFEYSNPPDLIPVLARYAFRNYFHIVNDTNKILDAGLDAEIEDLLKSWSQS